MKQKLIILSLTLLCSLGALGQQKSSKYFESGRKALDKKNYAEAVRIFSEIIKSDSTKSSAYFNRALAEMGLEQADKALSDFQKYHQLEPDEADGMDFISYLYYYMGDYENLIKSIQEFMKKGSTEYNSNLYLGLAHFNLDKNQEALEFLNYHLQLEPENELALYTRARAHVMLENLKEAEEDFSRLIIVNPNYEGAHMIRGTLKAVKKDYWGALEDLNKAVALTSLNANLYPIRGDIYSNLKMIDKAKLDYEKALELTKGENLDALYSLGKLMMYELADDQGALKQFDALLNKDKQGEYTEAYLHKGIVNTRLGNYTAAEEDFKSYHLSDTTNDNELNYYFADLKYRKEDYDNSWQLIEKYLSVSEDLTDEDLSASYQLMGKILIAQKKYDKALAELEKSNTYKSTDGETWYWMGIALKNLNQKGKACEVFKKAFELEYDEAETELRELCGFTGAYDNEDSLVG